LDTISLDNEVFKAYAFWTAIIAIKMLAMSMLTGRQRFSKKVNFYLDNSIFRNVINYVWLSGIESE
jgi:uncharacterized protein YjaG (DUF416 family)